MIEPLAPTEPVSCSIASATPGLTLSTLFLLEDVGICLINWHNLRVTAGETISLALTGVFGLISSLAAIYQVIDIRRRSQDDAHQVQPTYAATTSPPVLPRQREVLVPRQQPVAPPPSPDMSPQSEVVRTKAGARAPALGGSAKSILRARQLMLAVAVLTIPAVGLMMYSSFTVEPADGQPTYSPTEAAVAVAVMTLIFAVPLVIIQTLLSVKIGAARNWARITAVVLMLCQALFCTTGGLVYAVAGLAAGDPEPGQVGRGIATTSLGLSWLAVAAASIAASALLLGQNSRRYFRARQVHAQS